jgi:hypothetical protein
MNRRADLEQRLAVQMRKAFFDCLQDKLKMEDKTEAIGWLIRLHEELGNRFCAVLPSRAVQIREHMDNQLFAQQLHNGAYGSEQLGPLIEYTWQLLGIACAPDMDAEVRTSYARTASVLAPGAEFCVVVPLYLKEAHAQLDEIIDRVRKLGPQA